MEQLEISIQRREELQKEVCLFSYVWEIGTYIIFTYLTEIVYNFVNTYIIFTYLTEIVYKFLINKWSMNQQLTRACGMVDGAH